MDNHQTSYREHINTGKKFPLRFLILDLRSPENLGSLLRIADALGVEQVVTTGSSLLMTHSKVNRTARATQKYLNVSHEEQALDAVKKMRAEGYKIVCLELTLQSVELAQMVVNSQDKICLVLGSERYGIAPEVLNTADMCVKIPMLGHNSSMNVAAACAIATYDITQKMQINNN